MVVAHSFQDVFDASAKATSISLPTHKESVLQIEFGCPKITNTNHNVTTTYLNGSQPTLPFVASEVFHSSVVDWRRLTADHKECKAVYEISLDVKGSNFCFKPGDTIGMIPKNNKCEVDFLINHLNLAPVADISYVLKTDTSQNITKIKVQTHIPISSTIRHVLTHCVDFRAIVKKLFLLALARHTTDETERKVLEYLCSKEGSAAYTTHILNTNKCLLDILGMFRSCRPSIEVLFQHLPRLLPRPYSIVNSPLKDPNIIKICFSVMDIGNNRKGLMTSWIENIILQRNKNLDLDTAFEQLSFKENEFIPIYVRKNVNCFQLPETCNAPLILIGPGTGVAPYMGFLDQLECLKNKGSQEEGHVWLFFGCRQPNLDFIYQEELKGFERRKILNNLVTAFSRYENYEFKYVQDAIINNGETIVKLIKEGARIFVCGDMKTMAEQVKDAIVKCVVKYDDRTIVEAEQFIRDLQKNKCYIIDIWN